MIYAGDAFTSSTSAMPPIKPVAHNAFPGVAVLPIVGVCDHFTEMGIEAAAFNLRRDDRVRSVVLRIDSDRSTVDPTWLMEPISRLNTVKPTFAFIECAIGGSYLMALATRCIVAHPQAAVGKFAYQPGGEADPVVCDRLDAFNDQFVETLCLHRPVLDRRIARRLLDHEIGGGEALEHFEVVDMVLPRHKLFAALGRNSK